MFIGIKNKEKLKPIINLTLVAVILLIVYGVTKSYINQERYIYSWDYIGYQKNTDLLILEFRKSLLSGIIEFINALFSDYSHVFCIPILPFYILLGETRLSFILSLSLVYVTSFCLVIGTVFSKLVPEEKWKAFWLSTFIALLTPSVWTPILRGYPDLGGASIFLIGILMYWKNTSLENKKQPLKIAGLMTVLVLFRRHFAYAFRSFILTIVIYECSTYLYHKFKGNSYSIIKLYRVLKNSFILLCLFLVFSVHLVVKTFYFNYRELYSSYEELPLENVKYYGGAFGWIFISLAILGFILTINLNTLDRKKSIFLALLGLITAIQWIVSSRQISIHYTTQFAPFIILGLSSLVWTIAQTLERMSKRGKAYLLTPILTGALLILNFNIGLAKTSLKEQSLRSLFARSEAPLYRNDYQEVYRLINYLRKSNNSDQFIYIGASSYDVLNKSIIEEAEKQIYGKQTLNIIRTSDIDSRDFYPLNGLLKANYVIVTDPNQYHINADQQKVITVVGNIFKNRLLIANDFKEVPTKFLLDQGVTVKLYKRVKITKSETIISTLEYMKQSIGRSPGRETYWLTLDSGQATEIERDALFKTVHISPLIIKSEASKSLLYFGQLQKEIKVEMSINKMSDCLESDPIFLTLSTLGLNGSLLQEKTAVYFPKNRQPLSFNLSGEEAEWLKLEIRNKSSSSCKIALNHIVVSK